MTCKDCIHFEDCEDKFASLYKICVDQPEKHLELNPNAENVCKAFRDKSKFIELPCKFFQKCFVMPTIENNLSDITEMKCIGFSLSHDSYNANLITDKNKLYQPCFGAFGKTVFLSREEAERELERIKK